jgi:hypothetical protein
VLAAVEDDEQGETDDEQEDDDRREQVHRGAPLRAAKYDGELTTYITAKVTSPASPAQREP